MFDQFLEEVGEMTQGRNDSGRKGKRVKRLRANGNVGETTRIQQNRQAAFKSNVGCSIVYSAVKYHWTQAFVISVITSPLFNHHSNVTKQQQNTTTTKKKKKKKKKKKSEIYSS